MGGDGGVIASNRRYMRGAGTADHTADQNSTTKEQAQAISADSVRHQAREIMTTCALTKATLKPTDNIVACAYGRLYLKEAAVEALLRRKTKTEGASSDVEALSHVRKLSELYAVRCHYEPLSSSSSSSATAASTATPAVQTITCPITNKVLEGTAVPAVLLVPGKADTPNVVCESALQHLKHTPKLQRQLSAAELEMEYGPMTRKIRLAPPPAELERMRKELQDQRQKEHQGRKRKQQHKKKNKRKLEIGGGEEKKESEYDRTVSASVASASTSTGISTSTTTKTQKVTVVGAARSRVDTAILSNKVLSSLFTNSSDNNNNKKVSEKEHKDNLFAR
jgi:hypothetical protein